MKLVSFPRATRWPAFLALAAAPLLLTAQSSTSGLEPAKAPSGGPIAEAASIEIAMAQQGRQVQQTIESLADDTEKTLGDYRVVLRRLEAIQAYNAHMETLVAAQQTEVDSLNGQLGQLRDTQVQLVPLMQRMISTLDQFIAADIPFLAKERTERVTRLKENMNRADLSIAEKYRTIMEAFQIELDYARTIETYKDVLAGESRTVNFLRLGRVSLYYQTIDESETGIWDQQARKWVILEGAAPRLAVRNGIRMADKQSAPDLLMLPVPAPVAANAR